MVTTNEYPLYNYILGEFFKMGPLNSSQACLRVVQIVFSIVYKVANVKTEGTSVVIFPFPLYSFSFLSDLSKPSPGPKQSVFWHHSIDYKCSSFRQTPFQ